VLGSITLKNADEITAKIATMSAADKAVELDALATRVIEPYTVIAVVLFILAVLIYFTRMPEVKEEEVNTSTALSAGKTSIFQFPHLLLGALAIFFYVGVEVISYDTFAVFGEHLGYKLELAKNFATYTGYALLAGYIFNIIAIPKYISQQKSLLWLTVLSMILVVLSVVTKGYLAVICFMLLGFSNSVMWPAIWPLAIDGLGRFTKTGSALLIMGIVGGAILPPLYGKFSEIIGDKQLAYLIMIPAYLYILYYAIAGHKAGKTNS
jgi:glucose/galactose transporter